MLIDPKMVRELFDYHDGFLYRRPRPKEQFCSHKSWKAWHTKFCGQKAGSLNDKGYLVVGIQINKKFRDYKVHRLIWAWHHGRWPTDQIDHIDHDKLNNRIENLREVSNAENHRNQGRRSTNTSGVTGVYWHKSAKKWQASIRAKGKLRYLGLFDTRDEAINARRKASGKYGFHPNHGKAAS